jgi:hypothetical protein
MRETWPSSSGNCRQRHDDALRKLHQIELRKSQKYRLLGRELALQYRLRRNEAEIAVQQQKIGLQQRIVEETYMKLKKAEAAVSDLENGTHTNISSITK